jgi:site-specific recombinase XerD
MSTTPTLGSFLQAFFEHHLLCQKGVQPATVRSYRDALRLFLQFVAAEKRCKLTRLALPDLTCDRVLRFLNHLEKQRGNAVASRNQRLAALRCFFDYLAAQLPERLVEAQRVAGVPIKRTPPPRTHFLERDEIQTLFQNLSTDAPWALRDRTLLLFLYNTGARVQEVAELRVSSLDLGAKPRVHLHGKGDKWRICPLWQQSATLLSELLAKRRDQPQEPVFVSRTGQALTRFGIYKIVRRHTGQGSGVDLRSPISPHSFRHAAAVHLLEAGVEINVIRAWLGHVSLETTNRYAEITLRMKAQALEACEPPTNASAEVPRKPIWRDDQSLLEWLKSL